jgi:hypothetical protein
MAGMDKCLFGKMLTEDISVVNAIVIVLFLILEMK